MSEPMRVCRTDRLFHYLFNPSSETIDSILTNGLRPLSDFPDSPRWQAIQEERPGFFEWLYDLVAASVVQKPYTNSGIFVTPIDFRLLPDSFLFDKPRFVIPVDRFDPAWSALTYELDEQRTQLPLDEDRLEQTAALWTADRVIRWFAVDNTRVFYFVPQLVTYQPGGIPIQAGDFDDPAVQ